MLQIILVILIMSFAFSLIVWHTSQQDGIAYLVFSTAVLFILFSVLAYAVFTC